METVLGKCVICGDVEVSHFEGSDGEMSIPTSLCPTLNSVAKYYKKLVGDSYNNNTGNKISEMFEKQTITPSHLCPDDVGWELAKQHTLKPIEVWAEQV